VWGALSVPVEHRLKLASLINTVALLDNAHSILFGQRLGGGAISILELRIRTQNQ
jgi:hypothetical protein